MKQYRTSFIIFLASLFVVMEVSWHISTESNLSIIREQLKTSPKVEETADVPQDTLRAGIVIEQATIIETVNLTVMEPVQEKKEPEVTLPEEDIQLIALVTMGEAEGEGEYGKRLVIDTILNRMDSLYFPDTAHDVIYQKNQFSCMWDGRIESCYVMDDICDLVKDELYERSNTQVMFFTAGDYGKYGTPMFKEGNHYFCSYE